MKLKTYYYYLLLYKNHLTWRIEDNIKERVHQIINRLDTIYWKVLIGVIE